METKFYRYEVVANFPNFKKVFSFSGIDKKATFLMCVNFACGFIAGYIVNNKNVQISTNASQSIDGFIWWNKVTGENVLYIRNEDGKVVKTEE